MKTVFTNAAAVYTFVAQSQAMGGNSKSHGAQSFYFENNVAYSYGSHYAMCRIVGRFALIQPRNSSVTTNKLNGALRVALSQAGIEIIEVPNVLCDTRHTFEGNVNHLQSLIDGSKLAAKRSRKYQEMHQRDVSEFTQMRREYIRLFAVDQAA